MPTPTGKRPKATVVKQDSIEQTNTFLQSLPEKPKENLSLREAIDQMQDSLREALSKGYNYQELAALLTEQGIKISAFTLKNYVPSGRRRNSKAQAAKAAPTTRRGKAKAEAEGAESGAESGVEAGSAAEAAPVASTEGKKTAAKTPRGRGSKTAAAKATGTSEATVKSATGKTTTRRSPAAAKATKTTSKSTAKTPSTRGRRKATS